MGGVKGEAWISSTTINQTKVEFGVLMDFSVIILLMSPFGVSISSLVSFTCTADRKWRDNNDVPVVPVCLPGNLAFSWHIIM